MTRVVLAFALAACSSSKPASAPPPVLPPDQCGRVADHLISLMTKTAQEAPAEELDRVRAMFTQRCRDDGWSTTAQDCFLGMTAKEDVQRCAGHLTDAQQQALEAPPPSDK